jgi:hypothetical protein
LPPDNRRLAKFGCCYNRTFRNKSDDGQILFEWLAYHRSKFVGAISLGIIFLTQRRDTRKEGRGERGEGAIAACVKFGMSDQLDGRLAHDMIGRIEDNPFFRQGVLLGIPRDVPIRFGITTFKSSCVGLPEEEKVRRLQLN